MVERLAVLVAATLAGLVACGALLAALGAPVSSALAAPAGITRPFPGPFPCNTSLQACINGSSAGDTIVVQPGQYTASVTIGQAVNLTGVSSATVILHALPNQRVLTVTGALVNSSVIISGLTLAGGHAVGSACPAGCGGALLFTATAQPLLINLTISNSLADHFGGDLYADTGSLLVLSGVAVVSNTSHGASFPAAGGGGASAQDHVTLSASSFRNNRCTASFCSGGGLLAGLNLTATHTRFVGNTSNGDGGGAYGNQIVTLNGDLFQNNQCTGALCQG